MEDQTKITWSLTCMKLIQVKLIFGNDLLVVRLVFFHHRLKEEVSFLVISIHYMLWWPKFESKISASINSIKSVTTKVHSIIFTWSKKTVVWSKGWVTYRFSYLYRSTLTGGSVRGGGATINNDVLKFRKVIEFESSCII